MGLKNFFRKIFRPGADKGQANFNAEQKNYKKEQTFGASLSQLKDQDDGADKAVSAPLASEITEKPENQNIYARFARPKSKAQGHFMEESTAISAFNSAKGGPARKTPAKSAGAKAPAKKPAKQMKAAKAKAPQNSNAPAADKKPASAAAQKTNVKTAVKADKKPAAKQKPVKTGKPAKKSTVKK